MEMVLPREKKTQETKKKIVEAAGRLMQRYDFRYLTVKNVCEESGVAYGSFYHHFGSKEHVIYEYCRGLFAEMLDANPLPDEVTDGDFVRTVIWYLLVYSKFCELLGKDIVKYIYQNCSDDMFYERYFEPLVRGVIQNGFEKGYVDMGTHPERLGYVSDDIMVAYKGVVMCWYNDFDVQSHRGRLCVGMEHVIHQMLGGFRARSYHELTGRSYHMVTDDDTFDRIFTIIPELQKSAAE